MNDRDTLKLLTHVLKKLEGIYDCPSDKIGLAGTITGVLFIYVHNEPMFYFFNEYDLIQWLEDNK